MSETAVRGLTRRLIELGTVHATVETTEWVTPRMRRIVLRGPQLRVLRSEPGQQVRVHVDGSGGIPARRTYSVWRHEADRIELLVLDHGDGPGSRWAREIEQDGEVVLSRPQGGFVLQQPDAPYCVFVGEETGSVALGAMLRALPESVPVHGVIEIGEPADRVPLPRADELTWTCRHGAPAAGSPLPVEALRGLALPDRPGVAYVAGEAKVCQAVRRHFVAERGWPRRAVVTKPFWTPGRTGMD
jgi:NADPH-dependent ferric siderophore reductase